MAKDTWHGIQLSQVGPDPFPPSKASVAKTAADEFRRLAAEAKKDGKGVDSGILRRGVRLLEDAAAMEEEADRSEESRLIEGLHNAFGTTDLPAEPLGDPEPTRDLDSMTAEEISQLSDEEVLALVRKSKKS